jgi:chaperonin GroEL
MANKTIHNVKTQDLLIAGVEKTVNAIKTTLGPCGKCVAIQGGEYPDITRDGATVAKSITLKEPIQNMGAQIVKKAAQSTEEQAGDNTSTTSILIHEMIKKGQRYLNSGANVNEIKDGMEVAGKWVSEYIKNHSEQVNGDLEKIKQVATISANNDPEIGGLITECMEKVGINGVITADMSYSLDTTIEVINGMKIERGWASPHFITEKESGECVMTNPNILVVGEKITNVAQLIPILEPMVQQARPFIIICDDMDEVVLSTLVLNTLQGACRCCVLKGIEFGENRGPVMQDIATATGATYITPEIGLSVTDATTEMLGSAKKVVIGKYVSIIFEGCGDEDEINERIETIKARLEDKNLNKYDRGRWEKRLANLSGGIGVIHAGGASEVERVNKKATVEDAILASKSAIAEGVVPEVVILSCGHLKKERKNFLRRDLSGPKMS